MQSAGDDSNSPIPHTQNQLTQRRTDEPKSDLKSGKNALQNDQNVQNDSDKKSGNTFQIVQIFQWKWGGIGVGCGVGISPVTHWVLGGLFGFSEGLTTVVVTLLIAAGLGLLAAGLESERNKTVRLEQEVCG